MQPSSFFGTHNPLFQLLYRIVGSPSAQPDMSQPIILYDIAMAGETPADKAWSPNSLKTR